MYLLTYDLYLRCIIHALCLPSGVYTRWNTSSHLPDAQPRTKMSACIHLHTHTSTYTHTCIRVCMHLHLRARSLFYTCMHACMYAHILKSPRAPQSAISVNMHETWMHHTNIQYVYIYIYTWYIYIHIYIYIYIHGTRRGQDAAEPLMRCRNQRTQNKPSHQQQDGEATQKKRKCAGNSPWKALGT